MTYRQDKTDRGICPVCKLGFQPGEWMIDLFRQSRDRSVVWVHENCARTAMEKWITNKERKESNGT